MVGFYFNLTGGSAFVFVYNESPAELQQCAGWAPLQSFT